MSKIINCLIVDDEPIAREILENHLKKISTFNIVASCKNALSAFQIINNQQVDLIFLDINMPDISGLSFAKSINKNIKIIFTTAYREYAVDGFDLQAVDYLLKPISFERLLQAVNKFLDENIAVQTNENEEFKSDKTEFIFVRSDRKMIKINFPDIKYIESLSDYIKIYLNEKSIITRETITSIEAKLPQDEFIRTHRSFIVSISKIDSFTNEYIEIGKNEIPISRTYKAEVLNKLESK
ncbi:MAG: response regulator transcription factor [Bacteroidales bacterium]|nr:response regulator transcription factor [Bacteroidales bacterium]MBN2756558.1 response regulator transcription factor [Bacteroidales bacterium]